MLIWVLLAPALSTAANVLTVTQSPSPVSLTQCQFFQPCTVTVYDSNGGVPTVGVSIALTVNSGCTAASSPVATDASGNAVFTLTCSGTGSIGVTATETANSAVTLSSTVSVFSLAITLSPLPVPVMQVLKDAYVSITVVAKAAAGVPGMLIALTSSDPANCPVTTILDTTDVTGTATFSTSCSVLGAYSVTAADSTTPTATVLTSFSVLDIVFSQQPTNVHFTQAYTGAIFPSQVVVGLIDSTAKAVYGRTITVAMGVASSAAALYGTTAKTLSQGSIAFRDLKINVPGTYQLVALAKEAGVSVTSATFTVTSVASVIRFTGNPSPSMTPDAAINAEVKAYNANGDLETSYTRTVTVSVVGATLTGTVSTAAALGVANFAGLGVSSAGKYQLTASDGSLVALSSWFTVEPELRIVPAKSVSLGSVFTLKSYLQLANGSRSSTAETLTLSLDSGPLGGALTASALSVSAPDGSQYYNHVDVYLSAMGSYTLRVTCTSCLPATFRTVNVTVTSAAAIKVSLQVNYLPKGYAGFTYSISLTEKPADNVDISFVGSDPALVLLTSISPITFTPANYATAQTITLSALGAAVSPPSTYPVTITHTATSTVTAYSSPNAVFTACDSEYITSAGVLSLTVFDPDQPNLVFFTGSPAMSPGGTATYTVVLESAPTADVTVTPQAVTNLSYSPNSVTFTSVDWSTEQTITVTAGTTLSSALGNVQKIPHSVSGDPAFAANSLLVPAYVNAYIVANPDPRVLLSGDFVMREGTIGSYWVSLTVQPVSPVTVTVTSASAFLTVTSGSLLVFGVLDYSTPRTVTVTTVSGAAPSSMSYSGTLTHTVSSPDTAYNASTPQPSATLQVSVVNYCPLGFYAYPPGSGSCLQCPQGYSCLSVYQQPVACPATQYSPFGEWRCLPCPGGYSCSGLGLPSRCPVGTRAIPGAGACTACPAGAPCGIQDGSDLAPCEAGSYLNPGDLLCRLCPAGMGCSGAAALPSECTPGTLSWIGDTCSQTCPAGFYCSDAQYGKKQVCPFGHYSTAGQSTCTPCPAGSTCATNTPVACAANTYSLQGWGACRTCTFGLCTTLKAEDLCSPGQYYNAGVCTNCPVGYYCDRVQKTATAPGTAGVGTASALTYCTLGTYSGFAAASCTPAALGSFASNAKFVDQQCVFNRYAPTTGTYICPYCPPAFTCLKGTAIPLPCSAGYYCHPSVPRMQTVFSLTPCRGGTTLTGLTHATNDCTLCPAGMFCREADSTASNTCLTGYFCETGTKFPRGCPGGTYNSATGLTGQALCLQCPVGKFCKSPCSTPAACRLGSYCPAGSYEPIECPAGTYIGTNTAVASTDCSTCPVGSTCQPQSLYPLLCVPGTYNPSTGVTNQSVGCQKCTAGSSCAPLGLSAPQACGAGHVCKVGTHFFDEFPCKAGTETQLTNAATYGTCTSCPAGYYCTSGTGQALKKRVRCPRGTLCNSTGTTFSLEQICSAGSYNYGLGTTSGSCGNCPAGAYCARGSFVASDWCKPGFYCPAGTSRDDEHPCTAGNYSPNRDNNANGDCATCPIGYYCYSGSAVPRPCPAGLYRDTVSANNPGQCKNCSGGYQCPPASVAKSSCGVGYYSLNNWDHCDVCPAGTYCSTATTDDAPNNKKCPAGKWCPKGTTQDPTADPNFDCPAGYYCPLGTSAPLSCPSGTKTLAPGAKQATDCKSATAGYYTVLASGTDTGKCEPGFYCPSGSTGPFAQPCPQNTFMLKPGGASSADCLSCPAGYYCPLGTTTPVVCPLGSYCPANSNEPTPCPIGTLGQSPGLQSSGSCTLCPVGYYCSQPGLIVPDGTCAPGVVCSAGSKSSSGSSGTPTVCSAGGYCEPGLGIKRDCPSGTYNPLTGAKDQSWCIPCTESYYCVGSEVSPTLLCLAGYYCPTGTNFAKSYPSTPGSSAPGGTAAAVQCTPGNYANQYAATSCAACLAGYYCDLPALAMPKACPLGGFCPAAQTGVTWCPVGTFNMIKHRTLPSDCTPCTGGKYCSVASLSLYEGDCDAGYWCRSGSPLKNPATVMADYGPCPVGFYCPAGTPEAVPCPSGTFRILSLGVSLASCSNCLAGFYCTAMGRSSTEGSCASGFFCPAGTRTPTPPDLSALILRHCVAGQYCPTGSSIALSCAPGRYQLNEFQASCSLCPLGYYCSGGTGNYVASLCLPGYYCITGTATSTAYGCPAGTYNPASGSNTPSACLPCDAGKYCAGVGRPAPDGDCDPGYFCKTQSTVNNPTTPDPGNNNGGKCIAGTYCPGGSSAPRQCNGGSYCATDALGAVTGLCAAGYYCIIGASTDHPTDGLHGNLCPLGMYCTAGSVSGVLCPKGTYLGSAGATNPGACIVCPQGAICKGVGLLTITGQCPSGYFCPSGTFEDYPQAGHCSPGHMCPSGSFAETPCPAGSYQDLPLQATCKPCPGGQYCDVSGLAVVCPAGSYCPPGSAAHIPCPAGTYNSQTGTEMLSACIVCPPGQWCAGGQSVPNGICAGGYYCKGGSTAATPTKDSEGGRCRPGSYCPSGAPIPLLCDPGSYCNAVGLVLPVGLCTSGYYCVEGASSPNPMDGSTGDVCPAGYYCPMGAASAIPCPLGTYNSAPGKTAFTDCVTCPAGFYCASLAAIATTGKCRAGYYCPAGQRSPSHVAFICPAGTFCPSGSVTPTACLPGFYNTRIGQATCSVCPSGFTCEGGNSQPQLCAAGYSCGLGISLATRSTCGNSLYQPFAGQSQCFTCPEGHYCGNGPLTVPTVCPATFFCPQGTDSPISCLPGTYSTKVGLQLSQHCQYCPSGKYCTGGSIVGDCAAGFYCQSGSNTPTPDGYTNAGFAYPCPVGYYCTAGTTLPTPCPNGQFRTLPGGKAVSDCTLCQAGYYCILNDPVPKPCPQGGYCPAGSSEPVLCPPGTYNSQYLAAMSDNCLQCPAGTLCSRSGIGMSSNYPCVPGAYCPAGAVVPVVSPRGNFSPGANAGSAGDLIGCPGGFKCAEGAVGYEVCKEWFFCQPKSYVETPCPLGYFCGNTTTTAVPCPSGWYCPSNSPALREFPPIKCPLGAVCVAPAFEPKFCPVGEVTIKAYGLTSSVPRCVTCGPGSYANTTFSECFDCTPGYVCLGNTTVARPIDAEIEHGFMARPGFYAQSGAFQQEACPVGTFNPVAGQTSSDACLKCPLETYNDADGMELCYVCGLWANSTADHTTCECYGKNRVFLAADKSCPCKANYEYVDKNGASHRGSGLQDCEPIVFRRCPDGELRDEMGDCVSDSSCDSQCNGGRGTRTPGLGICECEKVVDVDAVCNTQCRQTVPRAAISKSGRMTITDPTGKNSTVEIAVQEVPGFMGSTDCYQNQSCAVRFVDSREKTHIGLYAPPVALFNASTSRRTQSSEKYAGIPNPVLCINLGETVFFSVYSPKHYPVFQQLSLLNTNPDFDFSEFTLLDKRMKAGWTNITTFAFTFRQQGLMLFADAEDKSQQIVISVMSVNTTCPDNDKYIQPRTAASLKLLGAKLDEGIILEVNWVMIYTLLLSLFVSILIFTLLFYYYSKVVWRLPLPETVPYREENKKFYVEGDPTVKCKLRLYLEQDSDDSTEVEELSRLLFSRPPNAAERDDPSFLTATHDIDTDILPTIHSRIQEANKSLLEHFESLAAQTGEYLLEVRRKMEEVKLLLAEKVSPFIRHKDKGLFSLALTDRELDTPHVSAPSKDMISSYRLVSLVEMDEETEAMNRNAFRTLTSAPEVQESDKQKLMDEISGEYLKLQAEINCSKDRFEDYIKGKIVGRAENRSDAFAKKKKLEAEARNYHLQLETLARRQQALQAQEELSIDQETHYQLLEQRAHILGPEVERDCGEVVARCRASPQEAAALLRSLEIDMQVREQNLSINQLREKSAVHKSIEEQRILRQREAAIERQKREEAERFFVLQSIETVEKSLEEVKLEETIASLVPMVQEESSGEEWDAGATLADISIDVMSDTSAVTNKRRDAQHESTQAGLQSTCIRLQEQIALSDGTTLQSLMQELARTQAKIEENEEHYSRLKKAELENLLAERRRVRLETNRLRREKLEKDEKTHEMQRKAEHDRKQLELFESALKTLQESVPEHLCTVAVRKFLEEKHEVEFAKLREKQTREQRMTHNALIEDSFRRKISDLYVVRKEFRARRMKMDKSAPNSNLKVEALLRAEQEVLSRLDYTYAQDLEDQLEKTWKDLRRKHAAEMTNLIDRQVQEARKTVGTMGDEAADVEKMLHARKERLQQEMEKKAHQLEQRKSELALRRMQQEAEIEALIQQERETETKKAAERMDAMRKRELQEKRKLFEEELRAKNISEDNMERMLQDYVHTLTAADATQSQEKAKQSAILAHKLAEKRLKQLEISDSLDRIRQEQERWRQKVEVLPALKRKEANKLLNRWRRYPKKPIKEVVARLAQSLPTKAPEIPSVAAGEVTDGDSRLEEAMQRLSRVESILGNVTAGHFSLLQQNLHVFASQLGAKR